LFILQAPEERIVKSETNTNKKNCPSRCSAGLGRLVKRDQVRFYQAKTTEEGDLVLSFEVRVSKNNRGAVNAGTYNRRNGRLLKMDHF